MMFIRVDLPLPDGPMIDSMSPAATSRSTPRRTSTVSVPSLKDLLTSTRRSIVTPAAHSARTTISSPGWSPAVISTESRVVVPTCTACSCTSRVSRFTSRTR